MPPRSMKRKLSSAAANDNPNNEKKNQTLVPYLPHDIWFEILSWLSATCLYNTMFRVSNTWDTMISHPCFVDTHLRRSRSGLFVQGMKNLFLEVINGNVEITEFELECPLPGILYSSYQGVCLFYNYVTKAEYVMNLVTAQIVEIFRPVVVPIYKARCSGMLNFSVIRDRCSGELKLVYAIQRYNAECSWYVQKLGTENSWKRISGSYTFGPVDFPGLSIGGFVVYQVCNSVVVFDVSDETIKMICCPDREHSQVTYIQMGNDLSCFSRKSERIFIHILMDFHAGKWSLYHLLDYGFIPGKPLEFLHFLGWINNSEELLVRLCTFDSCSVLGSCYKGSCYLTCEGSCYKADHRYRVSSDGKWIYCTYNLKTKRITYFNEYIFEFYELCRVRVHTNSLVSWQPLQG